MIFKRQEIPIHYEVMGAGPPLVLSHGVIESSDSWRSVVPALADHFRVVLHDARGRGRSGFGGAPFSYRELADDVEDLSRHLELGPFFHAGHSMGGRVALEHALAHPERVRGLAVVSARAEAPDEAGRGRLRDLAARTRAEGTGVAVEMWAKPGEPPYERVRTISEANPLEGTLAALNALVGMDSLLHQLRVIRVPTLVITGERDRAYLRSAEAMATAIPGARLVLLAGIGHFPNLESPGRLAEELITFFSSCP